MKKIFSNPGIVFIIKFLLLFLAFYYFHEFYIGISSPGGRTYSRFIETHLNYIDWLRSSLLHGGNLIAHLLGLDTRVVPPFKLQLAGGQAVTMVYSCIGYGVMSFWAAFVIANDGSWKKKLMWTLGGLLGIWFINCWRIALLLLTLHENGNINKFAEHHTMFNIVAYAFIFLMIYFFTKKDKDEDVAAE